MPEIKNINCHGKQPRKIVNGDTIIDGNLCQLIPDTPVCAGIKKLTFVRCNLLNCLLPQDAKLIDCLHVQQAVVKEEIPSDADIANAELENIKRQYPGEAKTAAAKVFGLTDANIAGVK